MPLPDPSAHPLVTYAQNREDLFLWALVGHRTPGTYVDVGCYDERLHSVTRLFYDQGWCGLNIDANDKFASQYQERTRDRFVCTGIGAEEGELSFRFYPHQDGLSTFDDRIKADHVASGYPYDDVTVHVRTLDDVLAEAQIQEIDFLKIDVEGFEPDVLRGLDLTRIRPTVITLEASRTEACEELLLPHRYHREFFDGLNMYYVDNDADDVTIFNFAGRILVSGFRTYREQQLVDELAVARNSLATANGQTTGEVEATPEDEGPRDAVPRQPRNLRLWLWLRGAWHSARRRTRV